jgi:hypothetical protein
MVPMPLAKVTPKRWGLIWVSVYVFGIVENLTLSQVTNSLRGLRLGPFTNQTFCNSN